jgi:hypothetical protein
VELVDGRPFAYHYNLIDSSGSFNHEIGMNEVESAAPDDNIQSGELSNILPNAI